MSQYTTGEMAKACSVTVRTVQYYDHRGILTPSQLTEGGRRLYSESDLKKMKIICFLRDTGLSLDTIGQLMKEEDPGSVISIILEQQEHVLRDEIAERQEKLNRLTELSNGIRASSIFTLETIGDIASTMENEKKLKAMHRNIILPGILLSVVQWSSILLWVFKGIWIPFAVWAIAVIPFSIWAARYYYRSTAYICPQCHAVFRPSFKHFFLGTHTRIARKLTCVKCGYKGYCVETWGGEVQ